MKTHIEVFTEACADYVNEDPFVAIRMMAKRHPEEIVNSLLDEAEESAVSFPAYGRYIDYVCDAFGLMAEGKQESIPAVLREMAAALFEYSQGNADRDRAQELLKEYWVKVTAQL